MLFPKLLPALVVTAIAVGVTAPRVEAQQPPSGIVINEVVLTDVNIAGNVLTAEGTVTGTIAGRPFTTDITNFALQLVTDDPDTQPVECSVLDLQLGPIQLDLLGVFVDTSPICLEITAIEGGGLLGDLLCDLAGGGGDLITLPLNPTLEQLLALELALEDVLDAALNEDVSTAEHGEDSVCRGQCEILELALGPVDLSLLGVNVFLDDCAGGPVQVCISASRGGGILGNLLCGLTNAQLINLSLADITQLLTRATEFLADGRLTSREIGQLTALLGRLIR